MVGIGGRQWIWERCAADWACYHDRLDVKNRVCWSLAGEGEGVADRLSRFLEAVRQPDGTAVAGANCQLSGAHIEFRASIGRCL